MVGYRKILTLIVVGWFLMYLYTLFPEGKEYDFWIFGDLKWDLQSYVYQLTTFLVFLSLSIVVYLFAKKTNNKTIIDITIINLIIAGFSVIWFVVFFDNPFSVPEFVLKIIVVIGIYLIYRRRKNVR